MRAKMQAKMWAKMWNKAESSNRSLSRTTFYLIIILLFAVAGGCAELQKPGTPISSAPVEPQQTSMPPTCLEGIWEIKDKENFLRSIVPVGSFDFSELSNPQTLGSVAYRFDPKGNLTVEAVNFQGHFDVKTGGELQLLDFRMNGFANAQYLVENGSISITEITSSNMDFSAKYAGEEMMADVRANGYLPLFVDGYRTAKYECSEDNLALSFSNFPNLQAPLEFKRLR